MAAVKESVARVVPSCWTAASCCCFLPENGAFAAAAAAHHMLLLLPFPKHPRTLGRWRDATVLLFAERRTFSLLPVRRMQVPRWTAIRKPVPVLRARIFAKCRSSTRARENQAAGSMPNRAAYSFEFLSFHLASGFCSEGKAMLVSTSRTGPPGTIYARASPTHWLRLRRTPPSFPSSLLPFCTWSLGLYAGLHLLSRILGGTPFPGPNHRLVSAGAISLDLLGSRHRSAL
ncbi:hypothetical protein C8Q79DRAFT_990674 [Trametes meyenii]|nr:hypothetical protein C8Q79DRAFT_990674 [Trametes meyenii]